MFLGFNRFQAYVADALDEFEEKQEALRREFGIGEHSRWELDLFVRKLFFYDGERPTAVCDVLPIGTYAPVCRSWMWTWANSSVDPMLRRRASRLKRIAKSASQPELAQPLLLVHSGMVAELVAMACRELDFRGAYSVPNGPNIRLFLGIEEVRPVRPRLHIVKN